MVALADRSTSLLTNRQHLPYDDPSLPKTHIGVLDHNRRGRFGPVSTLVAGPQGGIGLDSPELADDPTIAMHYRARTYFPEIGRFGQRDPAETDDRCYAYIENSPTRGTDPSGLQFRQDTSPPNWPPVQTEEAVNIMMEAGNIYFGTPVAFNRSGAHVIEGVGTLTVRQYHQTEIGVFGMGRGVTIEIDFDLAVSHGLLGYEEFRWIQVVNGNQTYLKNTSGNILPFVDPPSGGQGVDSEPFYNSESHVRQRRYWTGTHWSPVGFFDKPAIGDGSLDRDGTGLAHFEVCLVAVDSFGADRIHGCIEWGFDTGRHEASLQVRPLMFRQFPSILFEDALRRDWPSYDFITSRPSVRGAYAAARGEPPSYNVPLP